MKHYTTIAILQGFFAWSPMLQLRQVEAPISLGRMPLTHLSCSSGHLDFGYLQNLNGSTMSTKVYSEDLISKKEKYMKVDACMRKWVISYYLQKSNASRVS